MSKIERTWGNYNVLYENGPEVKLKELIVEPGQYLSMQRHKNRAELWFVAEGEATLYTLNSNTDVDKIGIYCKFSILHIEPNEWHQLANEGTEPLTIIEIQYGEECIEEDIERK